MTTTTPQPMRYRPTGEGTPQPTLLDTLVGYVGRWVSVQEALPPRATPVLVSVRGDNCPAFAWLKFAAGDRESPYFVCPQRAAMKPRGAHVGQPEWQQGRTDVTFWFAPTIEGLPWNPNGYDTAEWGLCGCGWETREERLNQSL